MTNLATVPWYQRLLGFVGLGAPAVEAEAPLVALDFAARPRLPAKGAGAAAVEEGQVSTWRDWTPDLLRMAEIAADRGDLSLAADLCDALLADSFIASKLGQRVRSLVGSPIIWDEGRGRKKGVAKRALEGGEDFWRLLPDAEYSQLAGWGVLLGAGLGQLKKWAPSDEHGGRLLPESLEVWHPRNLRFDWPSRRWLARADGGLEVEVVSGDGQWFLYTPFGRARPWVHGIWRQVARVWMLKSLAITEWQRANQTNGARVVTAQVPSADSDAFDDYTDTMRRRLVAELRAMGRNAVIALPPGLDLKLLEIGADTWESFDAQCKLCDEIVTVAFLGSSLATSGDKASYASSRTGHQVAEDVRAADANIESTLVHDDVLVPWAVFNFGDRSAAPWLMRQVRPPPSDKELNEALEGFGKAIKSLREDAGLPVDAEAMAKTRPAIVLLSHDKRLKSPAPLFQYIVENPILRVKEIREKLGWGPLGDERDNMFPSELAASLTPKPELPAPPGAPGAGGDGEGAPPGEGDAPPGKASKGLSRTGGYAKSARPESAALEGQLSADRLVEPARPLGPKAFRDVLVETIAAVEASGSYDEVRARLLALAGEASLEESVRALLEHLALVAWSAGASANARASSCRCVATQPSS